MRQRPTCAVRYGFLLACLPLCFAQSCFTSSRPQYLGVYSKDGTISSVGGALVTGVVPDGAAQQSGIRANDIIARMDGKVVTGVADLRSKIAAKTLGTQASVVFFRSTDTIPATVSVAVGPNAAGSLPNVLGFAVGVGTSAVQVKAVQSGSVADTGGLKVGDSIISVNGSPTTTLADAWRSFASLTSDSSVTLKYTREGASTGSGTTTSFDLTLKAAADAASWLAVPGLYVQDLSPDLAAHFNYIEKTGAQVSNLFRESPAIAAGLQIGDIIISLTPLDNADGTQTVATGSALGTLATNYAGQNVRLRYVRGQLPPATVDLNLSGVPSEAKQVPATGMLLEQLSDSSGNATGLRVEQVTTGGPAATAGIQREEKVTLVNTTVVKSIADFWNALLTEVDNGNLNVVLQITPTVGSPRYVVLKLTAV